MKSKGERFWVAMVFSAINRKQGVRAFCQVLFLLLTFPLYCIGFFVPKSKHIWVFGNVFGYRDDARYLFEYVSAIHPEITSVWICHRGNSRPAGISHFYPRFSLTGLWYQFRAGVAFVSTGRADLAKFTLAKKFIVQLWHGIPVKRILLDSPESTPFGKKGSFCSGIALAVLRFSFSRYSAVIASSPTVQARLVSAFGLPESKVPITGYPRHDIIWEYGGQREKRLLYAPTWRSNLSDAYVIVRQICNEKFIRSAAASGYELWVSIHPLNVEIEKELQKEFAEAIHFVGKQDMNKVLAQSEVLVTDYSSLAIDFSFLNRPVIFFAPDREEYIGLRGIYSEFETYIRESSVTNPQDISRMLKNDAFPPSIQGDIYFSRHDSEARKRIVKMVRGR